MAIKRVVALAGGVGGAKLADGLARLLPDDHLSVIVNIGDDFEHYGLLVCPDLDTVMYTLSDQANPETGWGLRGETWHTLEMLETYGEKAWFRLGNRDLATHLMRHSLRSQGRTLTEITHHLSRALGIRQAILPASDERFPTLVETAEGGILGFQDYFVRHRWQPTVKRLWQEGTASPTPEALAALESADAIIICPSNPLLSLAPILALAGLREKLASRKVPCVAVSPLIGGRAVKGPADKLMAELGYEASNDGIYQFYTGLIDGLVVNKGERLGQGAYHEADILMQTPQDRQRLARDVLDYVEKLL